MGVIEELRDKDLRMYDIANAGRSGTALCVLPQNVSTGIRYDVRSNDVLPPKNISPQKLFAIKNYF